eukprot:CAMPEP_0180271800 /NCGR_PEP_ID=MMETSP0988-20121125/3911_1 /TAXON_ID=697907 /ORGANISM="non described non described, Strain CCMP2293" /LENGTH=388 /DNA_ID=CAMNT_0022242841 /DNA_START=53 /DNA_END=1219 /DNA_ORIENTATION=+
MAMLGVAVFQGAVNVAVNGKKAAEFFRSMHINDEEVFFFWRMLDALNEPYATAKMLSRRHATLPCLEGACELCKYTIAKCETMMEGEGDGADSDEEETPGGEKNWSEWINFKREGVTRLQLLKELIPKLQICISTLQMALSSLPLRFEPSALLPRSSFRFIPAAQEQAARFIQQFEFGRVRGGSARVATGEVFRSVRYTGGEGAGVWKPQGACSIALVQTEAGGYQLTFEKMLHAGNTGGQADAGSPTPDRHDTAPLLLHPESKFSRGWMDEVPRLDSAPEDADRLVYLIEDYLLAFEPCERISAETFEAVLVMGKSIVPQALAGKAPKGTGTCLAEIYDLDAQQGFEWRRKMEKELGAFGDVAPREGGLLEDQAVSPLRVALGRMGV